MIERTLKSRLARHLEEVSEYMTRAVNRAISDPSFLDELARRQPRINGRDEAFQELELEALEFRAAKYILSQSQTIVFSHEQAQVFLGTQKTYSDDLDFRTPFECNFLQFTKPMTVDVGDGPDEIIGLLIMQRQFDEESWQAASVVAELGKSLYNSELSVVKPLSCDAFQNTVIAVFSDLNLRKFTWNSDSASEMFETSSDESIASGWRSIRNLAIACIGYINCENIFLHREGGAPEAVNRKRERQGKKILEPYYVCRIKGVQYDSNGHAIGEGTHHGFRYDVRGHFRKMATGKTTWVRPHQRGLQNELYVPKTYVVANNPSIPSYPTGA